MKKIYFLGCLLSISSLGLAQKTLIVNGGQFGNPNENVNLMIYDVVTNSSTVIDTIHTQSVQELLLDGDHAYVAAQDSLVKYDLKTETRLAAAKFPGLSTKSMAMEGNKLLVGNFYGQTSNNLYLFDKQSLNITDTIDLKKAVKSILVHNGIAYIPQNSQTSNFDDTLGYVVRLNVSSKTLIDTLQVQGYTGDFGHLIPLVDGSGFLSINSASNSITQFSYNSINNPINNSLPVNLRVGGESHYAQLDDTLFLRMGNGIGAIHSQTLAILDTTIVDTVVTAFDYDTLSRRFFVTQTDFFSYNLGKIYGRDGQKIMNMNVGFSPEVVRIYYTSSLGLLNSELRPKQLAIYPNPGQGVISFAELNERQYLLRLFNQRGQLLRQERISQNENRLDFTELPNGLYFIQLQAEQEQLEGKFIIQK